MIERRAAPFILLVWLACLTVAAAVLAVNLAPSSSDVRVNNAAGEDLLASSLTVKGVEVSSAPRSNALVVRAGATVHPPAPGAAVGQVGATGLLVTILRRVAVEPDWVPYESGFWYTGPSTGFIRSQSGVGSFSAFVKVHHGYVTAITLYTRSVLGLAKVLTFRITRIDGYTPPVSSTVPISAS